MIDFSSFNFFFFGKFHEFSEILMLFLTKFISAVKLLRMDFNLNFSLTHLAVQHERKPLVDRKNDAMKNAQISENSNDNNQKPRGKRESTSSSVNYLSLFQLNPLLMHAASASQFNMSSATTSPSKESPKIDETAFISDVVEEKNSKNETPELYESVLEQKLLNDTLDMIQMLETSLTSPSYDTMNGNHDALSQNFLLSLVDENVIQFKVQIPNLLPKMHFVCEVGSRVLFKTIDWLRDLQVFQFFSTDAQSEILRSNWIDLLIIGITQICVTSQQQHLKPMIVSTLINYVKSLIIISDKNVDGKTMKGRKMKKMMSNILMLNKFIDNLSVLELDNVEFAHLRLISFFNPNKAYLSSDLKLKKYQERIVESLRSYQKPLNDDRLLSIFQSLTILPSFDIKIIEKLFFNILVDFIRIDSIIPYIVSLNAGVGDYRHEFKQEKDLEINDENSPSNNSDDQRYYNSDGGDDKP